MLPRQHHRRSGRFQHESEALFRIRWVQGQIRSACLQNAQQPYNHIRRGLQADSNRYLRAHSQSLQMMRNSIGAAVQFRMLLCRLPEHWSLLKNDTQ